MQSSPLAIVKERFGDKAALVAAIEKLTGDLWVSRTNEHKGLAHVSNAKLLRLHRIFSQVKEQFGTRDKLIEAILEIEKRVKDEGYKARLTKFPVPRLFDMYQSAKKREGGGKKVEAKAETKVEKAEAPKKKAAAKKAEPKAEKAEKAEPKRAAKPKKKTEKA